MPVKKRNSLHAIIKTGNKNGGGGGGATKVAVLDRRHSSPFPEETTRRSVGGGDEYRRTNNNTHRSCFSRWNSSPFPTTTTEARFHKSEDPSLESHHVLEFLHHATSSSSSSSSIANNQQEQQEQQLQQKQQQQQQERVILHELSCEETVSDESLKSIQEILQRNNSNNFLLKVLRFPKNRLSSAAAEPLAFLASSFAETLTHLDLRHNRVGSEGLAKLIRPLTDNNCSLKTLNLVDNNLKRKAATYLADLLRKNKTLQELHIGHNPLQPRGVQQILNALKNEESKVRHLDLRATTIGGKGAGLNALIDLLNGNETIESLDLSYNGLGPQGAGNFASVFLFKNRLLDLNLGCNEIGPEGAKRIATALNEDRIVQGHCHLQRLTLDWNQVGDTGAKFLADALKKNATLQYLDLSHNNIGSLGAQEFATTISINYSLRDVRLNYNNIDDHGAFALASILGTTKCTVEKITWDGNPNISEEQGGFFLNHVFKFRNSGKTWLGDLQKDIKADNRMDVRWNNVDHTGGHTVTDWEVGTLVRSLVDHKPRMLQSIWLTGERITAQSLEILFSNYLAENPSLKRLYLKNVSLGGEGVESLQRALCTNSTLRVLSLTGCSLSAADAANLSRALKLNTTLERLNLQGNEIGDEGFRFLWNVVVNVKGVPHKSLKAFNVGDNKLTDSAMNTVRESCSVGTLEQLHLDRNQITDAGALDLARVIGFGGPTLEVLSVAHNDSMTEKGKYTLRMFGPSRFSC